MFHSVHFIHRGKKEKISSTQYFRVPISIYNFPSNIQNLINRKNSKKEIFILKIQSKIRIEASKEQD